MDSCPTCGCPAENCEAVKEPSTNNAAPESTTQTVTPKPTPKVENSTAEDGSQSYQNYYYVDFDWLENFSSDPDLLTFLMDVHFLKWLCAPWHISDKNNTINHVIANDIFFILNRFWKLVVFDGVWALCKGLPFILIWFVLVLALANSDAYILIPFITIPLDFLLLWFLWIGFGKSCKRYGIPFIAALRHLYIIISKDIKDNLK